MPENPFCFGIEDYDRFLSECKITLYPQRWNIWRVALNADRYQTSDDIQDAIQRLMSFLVGSGLDLPTFVENSFSPVDNVQWSIEPPKNIGKKVSDRLIDCFQPMWLTGQAYHEIYMRFVYRGLEPKQISWPAYKEWNLAFAQCPTDADIILDKVYEPLKDPIPEEPDITWDDVTDTLDPTKSVTGALLWGGLGLGAFLLAKNLLK